MQNNQIVGKGIERMLGFEKYKQIMESLQTVDISKDCLFQKVFNDYYEVR